MAGQAETATRETGLWDVVRETAGRASEAAPLATFIASLAAAVVLILGPYWLKLHYAYLSEREAQRARFEDRRRGEEG